MESTLATDMRATEKPPAFVSPMALIIVVLSFIATILKDELWLGTMVSDPGEVWIESRS